MDMAMALSQSASEAQQEGVSIEQEEDDVARAKRLSLTPGQASSAAEALSFKLWDSEWCELSVPQNTITIAPSSTKSSLCQYQRIPNVSCNEALRRA
jgi:hypothetical protein